MKKEKGSALVLTLIAVLLLSGLAITGLTVSTTEVQSTHNFYLKKQAHYAALEGVEAIRNEIYKNPDPTFVTTISRSPDDTREVEGKTYRFFVTGTLQDLRYHMEYNDNLPAVNFFEGFSPPPLAGISLTSNVSVVPVIWRVNITSQITVGKKTAYAEIESGIYSIVTANY